jgi:hypothetical protein
MHREVKYEHLEAEIIKRKRKYEQERGMSFQNDMKNQRVIQDLEEMLGGSVMKSFIIQVQMLRVLDRLGLCVFTVYDVNGHSSPGLVVEERKR